MPKDIKYSAEKVTHHALATTINNHKSQIKLNPTEKHVKFYNKVHCKFISVKFNKNFKKYIIYPKID